MIYIIQTNPADAHKHGPNTMFYCGPNGVRGACDVKDLVRRFNNRADAETALASINPGIVRFYGLAIIDVNQELQHV